MDYFYFLSLQWIKCAFSRKILWLLDNLFLSLWCLNDLYTICLMWSYNFCFCLWLTSVIVTLSLSGGLIFLFVCLFGSVCWETLSYVDLKNLSKKDVIYIPICTWKQSMNLIDKGGPECWGQRRSVLVGMIKEEAWSLFLKDDNTSVTRELQEGRVNEWKQIKEVHGGRKSVVACNLCLENSKWCEQCHVR